MRRMRQGDDLGGVAIATAAVQNVMTRSSAGSRSGHRVQHPEQNGGAWQTTILRDEVVNPSGSDAFRVALGFMQQRLHRELEAQRKFPQTFPGRGKDGVGDRRSDRRCAGLSDAARRLFAGYDVDRDIGGVAHSH